MGRWNRTLRVPRIFNSRGGKEKIKKRQRKRLVSFFAYRKTCFFPSNARDARAGHVDLVGLADPPSQMISKGHKEERPS